MADQSRETVGDESLENWTKLGSGGFAYVYKANHKEWGFEVAIKLLVGSDTLATALGREAGHMDSVAHQYVPKVYGMYEGIPPIPDLGYVKRHGIVMELMQRGSLLSLQKALSGPPSWALAFRMANQVAVAMNFLHSKKPPVVHSDLKPDNVLLDAYLDVKIADFGLSMVSTSVLNISNKGDEGGTLAYTPPEAFEQERYHLVRSYDIYSYGILLWTILSGNGEPYPAGKNRDMLIFRIMQGDRPDLHEIDQSQADGLEELVDLMEKCWDKDPTKRPTFKGCTEVTGRVFSKHEKGIKAAVNETLTKLDSVNRQESVQPPGKVSADPATTAHPKRRADPTLDLAHQLKEKEREMEKQLRQMKGKDWEMMEALECNRMQQRQLKEKEWEMEEVLTCNREQQSQLEENEWEMEDALTRNREQQHQQEDKVREMESEQADMRNRMQEQLDDYQDLLDVKLAQDMEIAAYRALDRESAAYRAQDRESAAYRAQDRESAAYRAQDRESAAYRAQDRESAAYRAQDREIAARKCLLQ